MSDLVHRPASRTAKIMEGLRRTGAARQVMPQEGSVMWPIPYRANGLMHLILPIYLRVRQANGGIVFPWSSTFTLEWKTERLVEYVNCRFKSPWATSDFSKPVGESAKFTEETSLKAARLAAMYDELFDTLAENGNLPPFWVAIFKEHLTTLVEPVHRPFYQQLSPRFYDQFLA